MFDVPRRVVDTVRQRQLVNQGAQVLVAVSGGPDSCALLLALVEAARQGWLPLPVGVAHFHHGLRGADADADAGFVAGMCAQLRLPCLIGLGRVPGAGGHYQSETARIHRYAFLQEAARELEADTIATAHNHGDQAETVLWRVLRGTGLDGLGGIPARRLIPGTVPPLYLVRPLIDTSRADIEAYCRAHHLATRHDPSNDEEHFSRVRLRRLLPDLAHDFNPRLPEALTRLADQAHVDDDLLRTLAESVWQRCVLKDGEAADGVRLAASLVMAEHPALRHRVLLRSIRHVARRDDAGVDVATTASVKRLDALLQSEKGQIDLPGRIRATLAEGILFIRSAPNRLSVAQADESVVPLAVPGRIWFAPADIVLEACEVTAATPLSPLRRSMSVDMGLPVSVSQVLLAVRLARAGDRIAPFGMGGRTRLVRSVLSEAHVPVPEREKVAVVVRADDDVILWVVGFVQAEETRVSPDTRYRIRLTATASG